MACVGRIDLWLTRYDAIRDEDTLARLWRLLSEAERQRRQRFRFADDRLRYLVTRAMVRTVLSHYAEVAPADWRFSANAHGRPEIAPDQRDAARGLRFNLSHTRGLIALGVSRDRMLGVDVEHLERPAAPGLAEHYFAPSEIEALARTPPNQRDYRFYEYWTFKEAYIKARGMGLSIPLDRFSFHYPHADTVRIDIDPALGDPAQRWSFWQFRPAGGYLLAICAERLEGVAPRLALREFVPPHTHHPLELAPSRRPA